MSLGRRCCFFSVLIITSWLMAACGGDPPNKELQQAQQAIDAARTSGAERYAGDEFAASESALTRARAAVVARDYRQALNDALDARDRANTAANDTATRKADAKERTDTLLHNAALSIVDARAKLRTAEAGRRPPRLTAGLRRDVVDAEKRVQEARTALDKGDYLDAEKVLTASMMRLSDSVLALESSGPAGKKKNLPQARGK